MDEWVDTSSLPVEWTAACGCQVQETYWQVEGEDRKLPGSPRIRFCAKHAAADALYEALREIASHVTTEEGDAPSTTEFFGIEADEVIAMAHDNMIYSARAALALASGDKPPKPEKGEMVQLTAPPDWLSEEDKARFEGETND
jgi:hypothetical protein